MTDHAITHDFTDVAALYALGALSQHDARSFEEHLAEGCKSCSAEVESFSETVRALGFGAPDEQPPAALRAELLNRVNDGAPEWNETSNQKPFVSVLASDGEWQEVQKGILLKQLHLDKATGIATSLVRMEPGTSLPIHQHLGVEQLFVIEGDCSVAGQELSAGDYHRAAAGSTHEATYTVGGTMFLLIAPERFEVLDAR